MTVSERQRAVTVLRQSDPILGNVIRQVGPCRLRKSRSHFASLFEAIVWQQLSWAAANTIHNRLLAVLGSRQPTPAQVLHADPEALRACGLSRMKTSFVIDLARSFDDGRFPRRGIARMSDAEIEGQLTKIKGIGPWSAHMFLMFALNRPDVFPAGDLGLQKAVQQLYTLDELPKGDEFVAFAQRWRPYRTVASWYLWQSADALPTR